jgi:hypothetical protein
MCLPRRAGTGDGVALVDVNRLLGGEGVGERVVDLLGRERDDVMAVGGVARCCPSRP